MLLDLTGMESTPETDQPSSVAREVELLGGKVAWGRWAIVASGDLLLGMSRVFRAFAEPHFAESSVFRDLEEAERWLARGRP